MKNEVVDVEVMENEDEVVNEIVPVKVETYDETSDESALSKKDMVIGGGVLILAAAGAVALGKGLFKGGKAIITKIKDKAAKKNAVTAPATEAINERPIEVTMPDTDDVEVVETE